MILPFLFARLGGVTNVFRSYFRNYKNLGNFLHNINVSVSPALPYLSVNPPPKVAVTQLGVFVMMANRRKKLPECGEVGAAFISNHRAAAFHC